MLTEVAEIRLSESPDRILMFVPGLTPKKAREVANAALAESRKKMPKMSGASAKRMQPLYGKGFFGIYWADCVAVGTKVLTADWRWVPVETLQSGDEVISCDEDAPEGLGRGESRGRRYLTGVVEHARIEARDCVEVEFDDGTRVVSTKSHPWLAAKGPVGRRREWINAEALRPGHCVGVYLDVWEDATSFEDGWLAGMFDGEGSYAHSPKRTEVQRGASNSGVFCITQTKGPVLERILADLDALGAQYVVGAKEGGLGTKECCNVTIRGGFAEHARILGTLRPTRLLPKLRHQDRPMKALRDRVVVSVTDVGKRDVVVMQTSTGTYMAEGMASHNSYVWFQEQGIRPFTMTSLQGKTIPMWVNDFDGSLRQKNPKLKTRVMEDGRVKVLIFRRVAMLGATKDKYKTSKVTGQRILVGSTPGSYPGAPGRIGTRGSGGQIAKGNVGVKWRHPGMQPKLFLNNGVTIAAQRFGILPVRVYIADRNWRNQVDMRGVE